MDQRTSQDAQHTFFATLIGPNKLRSGALNHFWNWQEPPLKTASIGYIIRYTKNISKGHGNVKKLLPRVAKTTPGSALGLQWALYLARIMPAITLVY